MVRCKFKCTEKREFIGWAGSSNRTLFGFKFSPVSDGSPENRAFYEATPGGALDISTIHEDVFVVGKEYYLDISEAAPTS